MKTRIVIALILLASLLAARAQDASKLTAEQILEQLKQMQEQAKDQSKKELDRILSDVTAAAGSPDSALELYIEAIRATEYNGKSRDSAEFNAWRKKNEGKLKEKGFRIALQYHLRYLALSLRRLGGAEIKVLVPEVFAYVSELIGVIDDIREVKDADEPLKMSINNSAFAKWYRLEGRLPTKDWEDEPGKTGQILDKTVMPFFRESKDPRLIDIWNFRIESEAKRVERNSTDMSRQVFDNEKKPELQWNRAKDLLVLGRREQAINDMFALINAFRTHPRAESWIQELKGIVAPK